MEHLMETLFQLLPLGSWLGGSPYGMVYGALVINALSCGILLLSKRTFGEYFSSPVRMGLVLAGVGGTALAAVLCGLYVLWTILPGLYVTVPDYTKLSFVSRGLNLIAYLFCVGYVNDFILRLLGRQKQRRQSGKGA